MPMAPLRRPVRVRRIRLLSRRRHLPHPARRPHPRRHLRHPPRRPPPRPPPPPPACRLPPPPHPPPPRRHLRHPARRPHPRRHLRHPAGRLRPHRHLRHLGRLRPHRPRRRRHHLLRDRQTATRNGSSRTARLRRRGLPLTLRARTGFGAWAPRIGSNAIWTRRAALATVTALAESGLSGEGAFERRSRLEHVSDTQD